MAQIPGLPIDEPVERPSAKPGLFGIPGETVAESGEETLGLSLGAQEVGARIAYANRQLKAKQAEIAIDRYMNQVYADLAKTTSVDEASEVLRFSQDPNRVGPILAPYQKDPRLGQIVNIAWQQAQAGLENQVNVHKAHLITEDTKAADAVNEAKTGQQAVSVAIAGGDEDTVKIFRDRYEMGLHNGASAGVYTTKQIDAMMFDWDQNFMKGLAKAGMDSPDDATRKRTISELKAGSGHFSSLDQTTRNALYVEALAKDKDITNLSEAADLDAGSAKFNQLTDGWDYDNKIAALNNDKWAVANGFGDEKGNPKRKLLDKIGEEVDRQEIRRKKVQSDKDDEIVAKYLNDADAGKYSDVQIDKLVLADGGSTRAAKQLKDTHREVLRQKLEIGSLNLQQQTMTRQLWQVQSQDQLGKLQSDIERGIRYSDEQIYGMAGRGAGKMLSGDVAAAIHMSHSYETDPTNRPFYNSITNSLGTENQSLLGEAVSEFDRYLHDHPSASSTEKAKAVKEIIEPKNIKRINKEMDKLGDVFNHKTTRQTETPPQPKSPAKIHARDPQGRLHEADAGTPLPAGWKLEGGQ